MRNFLISIFRRSIFIIPVISLIFIPFISALASQNQNPGGGGSVGGTGGGNKPSMCAQSGQIQVTLHNMKLKYDAARLGLFDDEKNWLLNYHGPSPIMSIGMLYQYSTDYLSDSDKSKIKVVMSYTNCSGGIITEFNRKEDFGAFIPLNNIMVGTANQTFFQKAKIEILSAVLSSTSKRRLFWTKEGDSEFFTNFNPDAEFYNPPARVKYSSGGIVELKDQNSSGGTSGDWIYNDIYMDGDSMKNITWDAPNS